MDPEEDLVPIKDDTSSVLFMATASEADSLASSLNSITVPYIASFPPQSTEQKQQSQALQKHMRLGSQLPELFDDDPAALRGYVADKFRFRALSAYASVRAATAVDLIPADPLFLCVGGGPGSDAFGCVLAREGGPPALVFDYAVGWQPVVEQVGELSGGRVGWGGVVDVTQDVAGTTLETALRSRSACVVVFHYVLCEVMRSCEAGDNRDLWMTLVLSIVAGAPTGTVVVVQDQPRDGRVVKLLRERLAGIRDVSVAMVGENRNRSGGKKKRRGAAARREEGGEWDSTTLVITIQG